MNIFYGNTDDTEWVIMESIKWKGRTPLPNVIKKIIKKNDNKIPRKEFWLVFEPDEEERIKKILSKICGFKNTSEAKIIQSVMHFTLLDIVFDQKNKYLAFKFNCTMLNTKSTLVYEHEAKFSLAIHVERR